MSWLQAGGDLESHLSPCPAPSTPTTPPIQLDLTSAKAQKHLPAGKIINKRTDLKWSGAVLLRLEKQDRSGKATARLLTQQAGHIPASPKHALDHSSLLSTHDCKDISINKGCQVSSLGKVRGDAGGSSRRLLVTAGPIRSVTHAAPAPRASQAGRRVTRPRARLFLGQRN